jgi:RNA polymerase sigma-70 factor (ECF subfamily)
LLWRRARGRERRLHERYAAKRRGSDLTRDPLEWLIVEERRELVRGALGRLPSRAAEILILKYGEDLTYSELAARLGLSEAAVESRLHRARRLLRNELSGTGEQGESHEE